MSYYLCHIIYENSIKFFSQVIGRDTIAAVPKKIAEYLKLEDPKTYTGHALRRTSATLLVDSGVTIENVKRHGNWKSNSAAEGYFAESLYNKKQIGNVLSNAMNLPAGTAKRSNIALSLSPEKEVTKKQKVKPEKQNSSTKNQNNLSSIIPNIKELSELFSQEYDDLPKSPKTHSKGKSVLIFNNCSFNYTGK